MLNVGAGMYEFPHSVIVRSQIGWEIKIDSVNLCTSLSWRQSHIICMNSQPLLAAIWRAKMAGDNDKAIPQNSREIVLHSPQFDIHSKYIPWGISKTNQITSYCTASPEKQLHNVYFRNESPVLVTRSHLTSTKQPSLPPNPRYRRNTHCSPLCRLAP